MLSFDEIKNKVYNNIPLDIQDGIFLYDTNNVSLHELGKLAHWKRTQMADAQHKNTVWWNTNIHLNPTNICIANCSFCAFAKLPNEEGAYTLTIRDSVSKVRHAYNNLQVKEVHIVGGLNPKCLLDYYCDLLSSIKLEVPKIHIKGFTAVEIAFFAKFEKLSYKEVLIQLIKAGLDSMPGGGAEIFAKSVRDTTCADKIYAEDWLEIHGIAHELGLKTNATMLAGIGESIEDRVDHYIRLREQQALSQGFQTFIPLACHYEDTDIQKSNIQYITGIDQIKNVAVSRLMLDNFPHIKSYWVQLGYSIAQLSLNYGANDLDGTVIDEKITYAAGSNNKQTASNKLEQLVFAAGFTPIERTTTYEIVNKS